MRRFFCGMLAVIMCILSCGCTDFQQALEQQLAVADTVVFVTAGLPAEFAGADAAVFTSAETPDAPCRYRTMHTADTSAQLAALRSAAADPSTAVLVVELSGSAGYAKTVLDIAAAHELPLLLCGVRPADTVLDGYENCWYVGFETALAAELQAGILVQAFRDDRLIDQSGDYKQSGLVLRTMAGYEYQPAGYANSLLRDMELGGIHTAATAPPLFAADKTELYAALDTLLLPQVEETTVETQTKDGPVNETIQSISPAALDTEFLICADVEASHATIRMVKALRAAAADESLAAYATPARSYALVCYGYSETIAAGLADGTVWGTVYRDTAAAARALLDLGTNLALGYSPTKDTNYHLEDGKYLMLDYTTLHATVKEQP